ncbi:hypothetical protein [Aneurinibacillus terranovensis]|uniref:hypothetical protein n=1 Tax=Aneurinibacillus terranovensis TaxID=278991 RepID=UPI00138AC260|nr:hypothetical protein [Aneurinibacillus terranovensis]
MRKKIIALFAIIALLLTVLSGCSNARGNSYSINQMSEPTVNHADGSNVHTEARFRGGYGRVGRSPWGDGYRSGYRSPSSNVTNPNLGVTNPAAGRTGGFWSHLGAFGAGTLLGSMFHPFGGYGYGYYEGGISIFGLLIWAVIIFGIYRFFRRAR